MPSKNFLVFSYNIVIVAKTIPPLFTIPPSHSALNLNISQLAPGLVAPWLSGRSVDRFSPNVNQI